ncbi:hypothetical protein BDV96DRAFT_677279 [Lophiotrema nucula]|uniref:Secreted protein CSS2 C-terminal domain-containing protein n=1 Tax=Lophiotrema nucula TaxID=690887 RepID=A0A6A5YER2_9PLEO|nr:hypothetical protein BDV96DRAFT_677279 [Lophiotrema nucula]
MAKLLQLSVMLHLSLTQSPHVVVNACCPGPCRTNLGRDFGIVLKSVMGVWQHFMARMAEEGSRTLVGATALGKEANGGFWINDVLHGVNYQYHAASSGSNCDTTAESKTVQAAIESGINFMNTHNINQACFNMDHGGTWQGLLQLAAGGTAIINNKCDSVTYTLTV